MILIDSDHLSVVANARDRKYAALAARLDAAGDSIAVPIVVVEEVLRGRLARLRRVQGLHELIRPMTILASHSDFSAVLT
jgi:predicted nucleic acid-binding protein